MPLNRFPDRSADCTVKGTVLVGPVGSMKNDVLVPFIDVIMVPLAKIWEPATEVDAPCVAVVLGDEALMGVVVLVVMLVVDILVDAEALTVMPATDVEPLTELVFVEDRVDNPSESLIVGIISINESIKL